MRDGDDVFEDVTEADAVADDVNDRVTGIEPVGLDVAP